MNKFYCSFSLLLIVGILSLQLTTALDFDNIKEVTNEKSFIGVDKIEVYNSWIIPGVIKGDLLWKGSVEKHTQTCSNNCESDINVNLEKDGVLVNDISFEKINSDGSRDVIDLDYELLIETNVKYIDVPDDRTICNPYKNKDNFELPNCTTVNFGTKNIKTSDWIKYNIGDELLAGNYTIKLKANKNPYDKIDWKIMVQGRWLDEWLVWGDTDLSNGLTHYWKLDDYNGTYTIDSQGLANATGAGLTNVSGKIGSALRSAGVSPLVVSNTYGIDTSRNWSINFWVNFSATSTSYAEFFAAGATNDGSYAITTGGSGQYITPTKPGAAEIGCAIATTEVRDSDWHMVTYVVYSNNSFIGYLDGNKNCSIVYATAFNSASTTGHIFSKSGENLYATMDEVGFWNRELATSEVVELYNDGNGLAYSMDIFGNTILNFPSDKQVFGVNEVIFNCSTVGTNIANISLYHNATGIFELNDTNIVTGNSNETTFNKSFSDGSYLWNCLACDDNNCTFAPLNRTFTIDTTPPQITINKPTTLEDYAYSGFNETLNITTTDEGTIDTCWYTKRKAKQEGVGFCVYNESEPIYFDCDEEIPINITFWDDQIETGVNCNPYRDYNIQVNANDSIGNTNLKVHIWNYNIFENSIEYNEQTNSGGIEDFILNVTLGSGVTLTAANLIYNGTSSSANIYSSGQERSITMEGYELPLVLTNTNFTFYWVLETNLGNISTRNDTQEVQAIFIDNCSVYTYKIFNISLYDEELKTPLSGDVELNLDLLNIPNYNEIGNLTGLFENINNTLICSEANFSNLNIAYSLEIRYTSQGYTTEFFHIQRGSFDSQPTKINLYDLILNDSTEFKLTYQDSSYSFIDDAIIQLQRKYISENVYEVVEAPLTSSDGVALVHIDLNTNKYKATIVKNGEILDIFDNLVFDCESELTGECTQKLLGKIDPNNDIDIDTYLDFYSTEPTIVNNTISVSFTIPSGTPSRITISLEQKDQFGNKTLCNQTIISSAGSVECEYSEALDRSYIDLTISKDGELMQSKSYIIEGDSGLDWLGNNYLFMFILLLSLVGITLTSPEWMITISVVSFVIAGSLFLARGLDFVAGLGIIIWIVIAAIIFIVKMSKQEDR